jgi:mannose-6-phosphate isomerase-like protein (cupin superfamily)
MGAISLARKLELVDELWSPRIVANLNDYHVKIAKVRGEFVVHSHEETDELFLVLRGELTLRLPTGDVLLREGELFVVPKGIAHQPVAAEEAHLLMIEPAGTLNTGDAGGPLTSPATPI